MLEIIHFLVPINYRMKQQRSNYINHLSRYNSKSLRMNHILSRLTISVKIKKIPEIPGRCLGDQYANQADTLSDRSEPAAPMTMISYARTSVGGEDSHICCITES